MTVPSTQVRAAGGVVWRRGTGGRVEVAVAHRPRYGDWSLPKGKLEPGEGWEEAALREVHEEIGARCEIGRELGRAEYADAHGRPKVVRYWLMEARAVSFEPNDEVDSLEWLPPAQAAERLSYERDRDILRGAGL